MDCTVIGAVRTLLRAVGLVTSVAVPAESAQRAHDAHALLGRMESDGPDASYTLADVEAWRNRCRCAPHLPAFMSCPVHNASPEGSSAVVEEAAADTARLSTTPPTSAEPGPPNERPLAEVFTAAAQTMQELLNLHNFLTANAPIMHRNVSAQIAELRDLAAQFEALQL